MTHISSHILEIGDDGFELESDNEESHEFTQEKPFDPRKVDVSINTPNMGALIKRLEHGEIDLFPDFQRSKDLWSKQAQSRLIESLLIRLPIPAFYFDAISDEKWQVVDGLQRLTAIKNFVIEKKLPLTKLEFLKEYEGCYYDDLPRPLTRRIDEFQTSVYLIKPGTPLLLKYSLFNRINTGGLKLKPQEMRHALSQSVNKGAASKFLSGIVNTEIFSQVVGNKNNRMSHEELALRHMAFKIYGPNEYKSSLPNFLDLTMNKLGKITEDERNFYKTELLKSLELALHLFGDHAFKKSLIEPDHKKVVNKP
ncbi:MAG: hypothetical protein ACI9DO_002636, partial [Reinekea sp.]